MSSRWSEEPSSDTPELPRSKSVETPSPQEDRTEKEEPEILSLVSDAPKDDSIWPGEMASTMSPLMVGGGVDDAFGKEEWPVLKLEDNGRERLKRHRTEVAGRVWIPDIWGQEDLLKDWVDCSVFDAQLMSGKIMSARAALVEEGRRANTGGLRIENRC
ncbi:hypothetical protein CDL15_Pgr002102 [Punica granatum]|nr:hypothetical protein CDL15_Pgr002102 [Punica granatum]